MKWEEFRDFTLVALIVFNVCLIALFGHIINKNTVRLDSLEVKISGLESAVDVGILEIGRAADDMRVEVNRLRGISPEKGGP